MVDASGLSPGEEVRRETADALLRADGYLSTLPTQSENEKGQLRDIHADRAAKSLTD
jgi:hypothetical protein